MYYGERKREREREGQVKEPDSQAVKQSDLKEKVRGSVYLSLCLRALLFVTSGGFISLCHLTPSSMVNQPLWRTTRQAE